MSASRQDLRSRRATPSMWGTAVRNCIALTFVLGASVVFAQGNTGISGTGVSRGNGLRIPQYRTSGQGAQSYFVDAAIGNDTFDCRSTLTPCLTHQGALNKIPKLLRDQVTITAAAGTYTSGFIVSGFIEDTGIQQANGGLLITGALVNSTLASGSATGTAAGGGQSAGSGSTYGVLCDSGATWTVNDLTGRFLTTASPTNAAFVISSNTATCITAVGTIALPVAASTTYAIQDPGVIVTGNATLAATPTATAVASYAAAIIQNNHLNYREDVVVLSNMRFANPTASFGVAVEDGSSVNFVNVQARPTSATAIGISLNAIAKGVGGRAQLRRCDVSLTSSQFGVTMALGAFSSSGTLYRNATAASGSAVRFNAGGSVNSVMATSEVQGFLNGFSFVQGQGTTFSGMRIACSGATGVAISMGSATTNISGFAASEASINTTNVTTCGTGLQVVGPANADVIAMTGAAATTGFSVFGGGLITFAKAGMTMTAGTNEINEDSGGLTALFADVTAGSCLATAPQSSRVCGR